MVTKASQVIPFSRFAFDPFKRSITDNGFHFKVRLRLESEWIGENKTLPYLRQLTNILNAFPPSMGMTGRYVVRADTLLDMVEHALKTLHDEGVINQFEMGILEKLCAGVHARLNGDE